MDNNANDQNSLLSRVPPNDQEAELAALSSMLFDRDAVMTAYETLTSDDFYRPDYKAVFEAMIELFVTANPIDLVTLKDKLESKGMFDKIGGRDALLLIADHVSTSANIRYYCKIISERAVLRRLIKASQDISAASYTGEQSVESILATAEKRIFDISQSRNVTSFTHIRDVLTDSLEEAERAARSGTKITGVETGFADFDNKTAGLHAAELILVAARPGVGKSALGHNIAAHAAIKKNVPTALFTMEMSKEQVTSRILCSEAMVDAHKFRTGSLSSDDWQKLARIVGPISAAPIYIDDTAGITVSEMRSKCHRLKLERGLGLIIVDYLQLMRGSARVESRQQEISEISRSLKALAREVEAPVIACAQLSRLCEQRADHRPMLSDLRESGAIEQDADIVTFIYREDYYDPNTEKKGEAEWIIAKQRSGSTGTVYLRYMGDYTKFADLARTPL